MSKPIYRYSYLGEAFTDTLNQLQSRQSLDEETVNELYEVFDKVYVAYF